MICIERGESDRAKAHYDAALSISERTGMGNLMAEGTWDYLAEWHVRAGRYAEAEMCSRKAIALRGDEPGGLAWGTGWLPLAKMYLATGHVDKAEKILLDVEAASQTGGIALAYIDSAFRLGWHYLDIGREEKAVLHLERALSTAAPEGHRWMFLTYGHKAVPVLTYALTREIEPAFVQALLCELGKEAGSDSTEFPVHSYAAVDHHVR
jgi:tetratricopeptide (TPR) repeat protein